MSESSPNIYLRLATYLRPYRGTFVLALICMVLFGASDGAIPYLVKTVLDGVFSRQDEHLLYLLPVALVIFAFVRAALDFGQNYLTARVGHCIVRDLRDALNRHLLKLSPEFFIAESTGNLLSRVTSDVILIRGLLTESLAAVIRDSIRITALLAAALALDPMLALIAFVVFPVGIYPVYRFGRRMRKLGKQGQERIGGISAMMQESMLGNRVVKIFNREKYEEERFSAENQKLNTTFLKSEMVRSLSGPINEVLASLAISAVILYGGFSVIIGGRTQGQFIAFLLSVFLLYDPFKRLSRVHSFVQQGLSGADRVFEVLDAVPSVRDPVHPIALGAANDLSFQNVTFTYPGNEQPALIDINIDIPHGRKVALVGFSGAGKSTFVDLIPRFLDPQAGVVSIGGVDVSRAALHDLRSRIAVVGQHTFLFNDSVFNNIAYGNPAADREQVLAAARAAYAYDFVMQLPQGFETRVGEGGFNLSGGERQRIAIARALLKDSPILILDEATASLDNRSEREVQSALEALEHNRTTVVIAHRLSTIRNADLIVVLKDGRIVERGTHEDLLSRGGEYERLHALQFAERPAAEDTLLN